MLQFCNYGTVFFHFQQSENVKPQTKYIWLIPLFSLRTHDKWQSLWVQKLGRSLRSPWGLTYFMFSSLTCELENFVQPYNFTALQNLNHVFIIIFHVASDYNYNVSFPHNF